MKEKSHFVICVRNEHCDDLELGKVYKLMLDDDAKREGLVRVIDESGEDYLYPTEYFVNISLPMAARQALFAHPQQAAADRS
jgi:hypothetical protein